MLAFQSQFLARRLLGRADGSYVASLYRRWSPAWTDPSEDVAHAREMFEIPGAIESTTAYYRDMVRGPTQRADMEMDRERVEVPMLVLAGSRDGVFRREEYERAMRQFVGPSRLDVVDGVGHFAQREDPDGVARRILEFL